MGSDAGADTDADIDGDCDGGGSGGGFDGPSPNEDSRESDGEPTSFVWDDVSDRTAQEGGGDPVLDAEPEPGAVSSTDVGSGDDSPPRRTLDPERYLLAGETLDEYIDVRRGWVVATSHRLVVFDPDADGKRFVTVDRPNVLDVRTTGGGDSRLRLYAFRAGLYAVALLASGSVARGLGLRDLFTASPDVGSTPGVGGLVSALSLVGALVGLVVDVVFFGGLLTGVVALALYAFYRRGRAPTLVVERAGEDDLELELPSNAVGRRVVARLERAFSDELAFARS